MHVVNSHVGNQHVSGMTKTMSTQYVLDSGLLAGQDQIQEMIVVNGFKKGFPSTSALRAVISMLMIQPSSGLLIGDTSDAESVMVSFMWAMMGIFVCVMVLMMLMVVMKSRFVKFGVVVGALAWVVTTTMAMEPDPEPSENHEEGQRGRAYGEPEVEESDPTAGSSSGQATTSSHAHQESAASSSTGTYQQEAASTYEAVPTDYVGDEGSADVDIFDQVFQKTLFLCALLSFAKFCSFKEVGTACKSIRV